MEIYKEIMTKKRVSFPKFIKDRSVKKFIRRLLSRQAAKRKLGGWGKLKSDKIFEDFDWVRS